MLELLADGQNLPPLVEAEPVELREVLCDLGDLRRVVLKRLPVDQVERIVQKVRVDLRLQRAELCGFHRLTGAVLRAHQILQLRGHIAEAVEQLGNLVAIRLAVPADFQLAGADALDQRIQVFQAARVGIRQHDRDKDDRRQHEHGEHNEHDRHITALCADVLHRDHHREHPAGLGNTAAQHVIRPAVDFHPAPRRILFACREKIAALQVPVQRIVRGGDQLAVFVHKVDERALGRLRVRERRLERLRFHTDLLDADLP